jgi:cytoskeletal protein RodZ
MAFTDMNDVEQELGEEKPPDKNGNRTFMIIAGILGGIMVLALLCIAGLALFRYLPGQRAAQHANETNVAQATASAFAASQSASTPTTTATRRPTSLPTNTQVPTKTLVIVVGPTKTSTLDIAAATQNALFTQAAQTAQATQAVQATQTEQATQTARATQTQSPSATPLRPTTTALPATGIAQDLGTPGLIAVAFILVVVIFLVRRLRTAS